MKILYIANGNGMSPIIGGSLKRTLEVSKRLQALGWDVEFITTLGGYAVLNSELSARFHIVRSSILGKKEKTPFDRLIAYSIATFFSIFAILRLGNVDLVCSDSDYFCDVIPATIVRLRCKSKWIAMSHHLLNRRRLTNLADFLSAMSVLSQRLSYLLFRKYADSIFVLDSGAGEEVAEYLTVRGFDNKRINFVRNGVDLNLIRQFDYVSQSPIHDACFIGGMRPRKGGDDLLSIWSQVVSRIPNALLVVVGGGLQAYERVFRRQLVERGLQMNVKIAGYVPKHDLILHLKSSKLFISPSREEGWGIAICEAMACGTPVVAYDLPAYRAFGDSLIRVPRGDASRFATAVVTFLEDEKLREKYATLGKATAAGFDWNEIASRESVIFQRLIRGGVDGD